MAKTGIIILVHGSRGERAVIETPQVLQRIAQGLRLLLSPEVEVTGAALQFNHPDMPEAVKSLVAQGATRIVVAPYFLFSGKHVTEDIPQLVEEFRHAYPQTQFVVTGNLGLDESFVNLMAKRIIDAVPALRSNSQLPSISTSPIEEQSMDIVEDLLPPLPATSEEERKVIKRIVHTCGDPQIASLVKFSPSAVSSSFSAIAKGSAIITDVRMVATGINKRLTQTFGCPLVCSLDGMNPEDGETQASTRTAAAMRRTGAKLNGAIVAIGNAPTALLALIDMIDHQDIAPALVVGMPVGFVKAAEAKAELMKRDIPYITVTGTRGGSPMAAATVNALLKIAVENNGHV
ncbi:MAG: precorrin-8X methylmutase [Chloroflexi bacterium]|nr:precorrin-8X methylmutase [Chloroflexota bacterium]